MPGQQIIDEMGKTMSEERKDYAAYRESEEYKHLKELRRKKRQREVMIARICVFGGAGLILLALVLMIYSFLIAPHMGKEAVSNNIKKEESEKKETYFVIEEKPNIDVQLLTPNNYSRPGIATETITNIVVHYTANPGTTAQQNRDFFEGLKDSHETSVSSHFVVGLDGEIIQCVPTVERAYASNQRNFDTVSIECCHLDETGKFNDTTYNSLVQLCAWLCGKFNLQAEDVIRHYDVTGKSCPKYFVDNQGEWDKFIQEVDDYIKTYGKEVTKEEHDIHYGLAQETVTPATQEEVGNVQGAETETTEQIGEVGQTETTEQTGEAEQTEATEQKETDKTEDSKNLLDLAN